MNLIFNRSKNQPPSLHKKTTFKFRVESFLVDNQMWLLAWGVSAGSVSVMLLAVLLYMNLATPAIGGIV